MRSNQYFFNQDATIKRYLSIAILLFFIFLIHRTVFVLEEGKVCFLVRFGKIIKKTEGSGLKIKNPILDDVVFFEKRTIHLPLESQEIISIDQKRFTVDAYAKYKIIDPDLFYRTLKREENAKKKINSIFDSLIRQVLGTKKFINILNKDRSETMSEVESKFNDTLKTYGIKVVDVRIVKVDLPIQNSNAIFERMRTERKMEAVELIASGEKEAEIMKANSVKESEIIISQAKLKAARIRADGKAHAVASYNDAMKKNIRFYQFYQRLKVYAEMARKNPQMILSQDKLKNLDFLKSE